MLVDFGLVKLFDPSMKTTIGARAVTPGFAPPEQYGQGSTDPRTDIYALGATLYNLLTNQQPMESIRRMVGGKMKTAHELTPEVPESLSKIIEHAMDLEPNQRFQNSTEFKNVLQRTTSKPESVPAVELVKATVVASPVREQQSMLAEPFPTPASRPQDKPPSTGRFTMGMGMGVVVLLVVCLIAVVAAGWWLMNSQGKPATQTANAEIQATTDARVRLTSTAQALENSNLDSTEQARLTAVAKAGATATAQAGLIVTAQSLDSFIQNILNNRTLVFGPIDGNMKHNAEDTLISVFQEPADLRDFVAEVNFINPYSPTTGNWDYGLLFRHEDNNRHFRLVLRSDKKWVLLNNSGDPDGVILQDGDIPDLKTDEGQSNFVRLICQGTQGYFYVNDELITVLDLSARTNSGGILLATGLYLGDEITGKTTGFSQYTVWSIP